MDVNFLYLIIFLFLLLLGIIIIIIIIRESKRLDREAEDLQREAERSELSLDELTTLREAFNFSVLW